MWSTNAIPKEMVPGGFLAPLSLVQIQPRVQAAGMWAGESCSFNAGALPVIVVIFDHPASRMSVRHSARLPIMRIRANNNKMLPRLSSSNANIVPAAASAIRFTAVRVYCACTQRLTTGEQEC